MDPFENLIRELGILMDVELHPDSHQSCLITFTQDGVAIQIDLDTHADRLLIGTQLGRITPGPYRERIFLQALRTNGTSQTPRGILAFSEKNDSLVLYQFLTLALLNGAKLHQFLQLFHEHAKVWQKTLVTGDIPTIQEEVSTSRIGMFGLKP